MIYQKSTKSVFHIPTLHLTMENSFKTMITRSHILKEIQYIKDYIKIQPKINLINFYYRCL